MTTDLHLPVSAAADEYDQARRRGQARAAAANIYCIEGEHLNMRQIAERLGVSRSAAQSRMRTARDMPGPVTWERLRAIARTR